MTRLTHLLTATVLAGSLIGGVVAVGCGSRPGEAPPLAPRPELDPANSPMPTGDPSKPQIDAGTQDLAPKGPVAISRIPTPEFQASSNQPTSGPTDAGVTSDGELPLPPVPDATLPDSRLEPRFSPSALVRAPMMWTRHE